MTWWEVLLSGVGTVAGALVGTWLVLLVLVRRQRLEVMSTRAALRLLPDLSRLLVGLARDERLPRPVRWTVWSAVGYLALPVDLVPDVIPVIGWADDVVVVVLVLRLVVRHAGVDLLSEHWAGSEAGRRAIVRLAGLDRRASSRPSGPPAEPA